MMDRGGLLSPGYMGMDLEMIIMLPALMGREMSCGISLYVRQRGRRERVGLSVMERGGGFSPGRIGGGQTQTSTPSV